MVTLVKDVKVIHDVDDVMTHQTHTKERIYVDKFAYDTGGEH
jgi:hypothetical protein